MKNVTVLAGGVGGARFTRGLLAHLAQAHPSDAGEGSSVAVTVVVNTGDDMWLNGLRVCPDLDSVMYTLGGVHDAERGWGREHESWRIKEELTAYGAEPSWFALGDLDIAT
ncbi:MAG: 2-phospho-L-lactate transferase, partial [Pseudonocardiales bacterium]|nr:2-phospho-L-lactate transferase [Pseudonocardiales bacterium]